jgi:mono/diheme cytochrome c family protein
MTVTGRQIAFGAAALVIGSGLAAAVPLTGIFTVAGTDSHTAPVRWFLQTTMVQSVRRHARSVEVPRDINLKDPALSQRGFGHYSVACTPCHGAPGVKPAPWMVINPAAPLLTETARRWSDAELFWIIKNGIKMTGMPALGTTHPDEPLWAITALVRQLPTMSAEEYEAMARRHEAGKQSPGSHAHEGM